MEGTLVLNASLMEKLEVHVQVGASRVPRELADGGRVSWTIDSDGEEDGDGQDNGSWCCWVWLRWRWRSDHNGCLWVSIWWEWPHLLSIHDHPSHHQPCSFCTKRTQNRESKGPTSTMAVWDVSEWVVPGAHLCLLFAPKLLLITDTIRLTRLRLRAGDMCCCYNI